MSGRVDRTPATERVEKGLISGRVKQKTIKISIHSFPAWRSALKWTVWSLHCVWWTDGLWRGGAWLEGRNVFLLSSGQCSLVNKV